MSDIVRGEPDMSDRRSRLVRESAREIVVVVASILIAFSLDAWWDAHVERQQERALLTSLLHEFRANQPQLEQRLGQIERVHDGANAVALILSDADGGAEWVADSLLVTLFVTPTFDPALGTLDEAQSSGRTGLVRDPELRAALGSWPGLVLDAGEEQRLAQETVQRLLFPALAQEVYLGDLMEHGGRWLVGRFPEGLRSSGREIRATPAAANYAQLRSSLSRIIAEELNNLLAHLESIVALLEGELGSSSS